MHIRQPLLLTTSHTVVNSTTSFTLLWLGYFSQHSFSTQVTSSTFIIVSLSECSLSGTLSDDICSSGLTAVVCQKMHKSNHKRKQPNQSFTTLLKQPSLLFRRISNWAETLIASLKKSWRRFSAGSAGRNRHGSNKTRRGRN